MGDRAGNEGFSSGSIQFDVGGKFRFHLKVANGEIIAVSQAHVTKETAMKGIESVKKTLQ